MYFKKEIYFLINSDRIKLKIKNSKGAAIYYCVICILRSIHVLRNKKHSVDQFNKIILEA